MAGETEKAQGIVLDIHPVSRTSHVVVWLVRGRGVVSTLVKGAVRPKSQFLGQYDLHYTCDLIYYQRASGDLHAIREVSPKNMRERLRGRWRETCLAGYAAGLARELCPSGPESERWFDAHEALLERLGGEEPTANLPLALLETELSILSMAGLSPDFSGADPRAEYHPFAVDGGRIGEGGRTVRISPQTLRLLESAQRGRAICGDAESTQAALRVVGAFMGWHLDRPSEIRRSLLSAWRSTAYGSV